MHHVRREEQSVLLKDHRTVRIVPDQGLPVRQAIRRGAGFDIAADAQHQPFKRLDALQPGDDVAQMRQPRRRVQLDDQRIRVTAHDQAGQSVVFAMYQPVAGRALRTERLADSCRRAQPLDEPRAVNRGRLAVLQDADPDRRIGIVQANRQETPLGVEDHRQVAGLPRVALFDNRLIEQPGMAAAQRAFCRRGDLKRNAFV